MYVPGARLAISTRRIDELHNSCHTPEDIDFRMRCSQNALAQHLQNVAQLGATERSLLLQLARVSRRIDADTVAKLSALGSAGVQTRNVATAMMPGFG